MSEVTRILSAIERGDSHAADQLLPLVYDELRRLAALKMAQEAPGQTLQATALVHEAYLRLVDAEKAQRWDSRGHFFAAAAAAMRRILVENARHKHSRKRGGGLVRQDADPDDFPVAAPHDVLEVLAVHEALDRLAQKSPRKAELVKLCYFLGCTMSEAAQVLWLRQRRHLLVTSLLIALLAAILISRLPSCGSWPSTDEGQGRTLAGHTFPVQALAFSPDGATLTSAAFYLEGRTGGVEVVAWAVETGHPVAKSTQYPGGVLSLVFPLGGSRLAAVQERTLLVCDLALWRERRLDGLRPPASALAFSDDGTQLASVDFDSLTLQDVAGSRPRACWTRPDSAVSLAFSPGGTVVASGGADSVIRLWDAATGRPRGSLRGHVKSVMAVAFAPDGATLASAEFRGTVKLWDLATLTERSTLEMSGEEISNMAFAPDGRTLAMAVGPAVQLGDLATGRHIASLEGHEGRVNCLAYSPDGTRLASGGPDRTVHLWDATPLPAKP